MFSNFLLAILLAILTAFVGANVGSISREFNLNPRVNASNSNVNGYSKDQCKDGGWRELGFTNQGRCVSYFVRSDLGQSVN